MTRDLSEVSALLLAFRDGSVSPEQFAERYAPLWRELIREQNEAIAAQPTIGSSLPRLREMESRGEISTDEYQEQVQRLYASLSGVRLRPGTAAANALDQVYVIADACGDISAGNTCLLTKAWHAKLWRLRDCDRQCQRC